MCIVSGDGGETCIGISAALTACRFVSLPRKGKKNDYLALPSISCAANLLITLPIWTLEVRT